MGQAASVRRWPPWWTWAVAIASIPSLSVVALHVLYVLFALLVEPILSPVDWVTVKTLVAVGFVVWVWAGLFLGFPGSAIAALVALLGTLIDKRESDRWPVWAFLGLSLAGNAYFYVALQRIH